MASRNDVATSPGAEKTGRDSARVEISGLTKRFLTPAGEVFTALQDVSFTVEPGQFCAVVGPHRLRQVDDAEHGVRARPAQRGLGQGRRP